MKIIKNQNELIWRDNNRSTRIFGLIFALIGLLLPLLAIKNYTKSSDAQLLTAVVIAGMGVVFVLLGLTVFFVSKNREIVIRKKLGEVIYRSGKIERVFNSLEIDKVELVTGTDDDGDVVYTPWLKLKTGEYLQIYNSASASPETFSRSVTQFNDYLTKTRFAEKSSPDGFNKFVDEQSVSELKDEI